MIYIFTSQISAVTDFRTTKPKTWNNKMVNIQEKGEGFETASRTKGSVPLSVKTAECHVCCMGTPDVFILFYLNHIDFT